MIDHKKARIMLEYDEGKRRYPYDCSTGEPVHARNGKVSIGVGRNLEAKPLSNTVIDILFIEDLQEAIDSAVRLVPLFEQMGEMRQLGIVNLVFNLGEGKLARDFPNTIRDLRSFRFDLAASRLRHSSWYRQVKLRAERVLALIERAEFLYPDSIQGR